MTKTSIFYYTNNVISRNLLEYTFREAIKQCQDNNCEMIVTSHYPITESFTNISIDESLPRQGDIYNYIVKDLSIKTDGDIKCYVVGQLPYSYGSIIKQLLLSIDLCSGDNIILMEHDCLYPSKYISTVNKYLIEYDKDMTYCCFNNCFLNEHGYFNIENGNYVLSTFAFKKEVFKRIYRKKLELLEQNKTFYFEPILSIDKKNYCPEEIVVSNHICIDTFLGEYHCPLDIKHGLNTDGLILGNNYCHSHPYWGEDKKYLDMISSEIDKKNKKLWSYGTGKLNY